MEPETPETTGSEDSCAADPIKRGADLTDADLALIAEDMQVVTVFCMRNRLKRPEWQKQLLKTLRWRLGRATDSAARSPEPLESAGALR